MCLIGDLGIVDGMTGNHVLDAFLITLAALFFIGAGVFLPLWEYLEGRAPRRRMA